MNRKIKRFLAPGIALVVITGCASENNANSSVTTKVSENFLNLSNEDINTQGKLDFESLVIEEDEFTKETYYKLPKNELPAVVKNDIDFSFFLYKENPDVDLIPSLMVSFYGDDWKFLESAILKVNDDVLTIRTSQEPMRDTFKTGAVSEIIFFDLDKETINFLGKSKSNSDLDVRMNGKSINDVKFNAIEYKGMKKILSAYRYYLNNKEAL